MMAFLFFQYYEARRKYNSRCSLFSDIDISPSFIFHGRATHCFRWIGAGLPRHALLCLFTVASPFYFIGFISHAFVMMPLIFISREARLDDIFIYFLIEHIIDTAFRLAFR